MSDTDDAADEKGEDGRDKDLAVRDNDDKIDDDNDDDDDVRT
jgi:hypothetical protein